MDALLHISTIKIVGIILIIIGFAMRYYVNKQRFNRRGAGGMQHYSSYGRAVVTSTLEKLLKIIGLVFLLIGFFFVWVDWYNYSTEHHNHTKPNTVKTK